jgi:hypothetical protein
MTRYLTILAVAILLAGVALVPRTAAAQDAPALPTLDVLLDNPLGFIGQTVTVQGQVDRVLAGQGFTVMSGDGSSDRLLVISAPTPAMRPDHWTGPWARDWKEGDPVLLVGRIATFRLAEYEEAYNVDVTDDFFRPWEGRPALFVQLVDVLPEQ